MFHSYNENIIFIPRQHKIQFKKSKSIDNHYSILGIGMYYDNYPFLFDAINEKGIGVSCLNFVGNAEYYDFKDNKINLAPYELILYLLSECSSLDEVKRELININLINVSYDSNMPISQLHFMVSSREGSIVIESTKKGLIIYDNFLNVFIAWSRVHNWKHCIFQNCSKSSCSGFEFHCFFCKCQNSFVCEFKFNSVNLKQFFVLLNKCISWFGQNLFQCFFIKFFKCDCDWNTTNKFWNKTILDKVMWFNLFKQCIFFDLSFCFNISTKTKS